jgi:UMF1 family MFS transporter
MRFVPEHRGPSVSIGTAVRTGLKELGNTISHIRGYRTIVLFLFAYWFYIDGVNTIIKQAVDYGMTINLPKESLIVALLITQFVGFPAAILFGWLGTRIGARTAILFGIGAYIVITSFAYFMSSAAEFYALAIGVGLVQGGVQSLSRSLFGRLVPEGKNAEFFGFFNMLGKFATFFGPLMMALVNHYTHDQRKAIISLLVLFVVGGALLLRVPADRANARA